MAYDAVNSGRRCCSLGEIIHNPDVTRDLSEKGLRVIESPDEIRDGETVIIRAHGITPEAEERLREKGAHICDATCPFVSKIHGIVSENSAPDIPTLIAGDASHPEVIGIRGCCKGVSYVFSSAEELKKILDGNAGLCQKRIIAVSQTTFSENEWKKSKEIIKFLCTNTKIFDTICSATRKRQEEAQSLSLECDAVIVIGGRHSSNTAKLRDVCSENCDTFLVERAEELKNIDFSTYARVGVTAGASTPAAIIKEVLSAMSDNIKETENTVVEEVPSVATSADSENFVELLNDTLVDDSVIKCTVYGITPTEVQVDIPKNHILGGLTGIVPNEEFSADPNVDPSKEVKIGDEINLVIMKKNDAEGTVLLSKKRADALKSWVDIIDGKEDGRIFEGTVIEAIKGGVIVSSNGSNVFIPASLATERRGDSLDGLLKKNVEFRIIDVDPRRKRAVGSIRSVLAEKKQQIADAFWAQVEEGKSYTGTVKSLTNYGAFVDIGGVDGMVHISEMSWRRIKNPSEIFEVGQEVEVYVKSLDRENKKISLGYRKDEDNPWVILQKNYPEGSVIEAEIVGLTTFGAFARVIPGIDGLIHISQIANHRVEKPENELSIGEKVTCKITGIDFDKKRVSLSIRALLPAEPEVEEAAEEAAAPAEEAAEEAAEAVEEAAAPAEEAVEEAAEAAEEAAAPAEEAVEEAAEAVEEAAAPVEEAVEEAAEAVEEAAAPVEEAVEEAAEAAEEAAAPAEETPAE